MFIRKGDDDEAPWGEFGFSIMGNASTGVVVKQIHVGGSAHQVLVFFFKIEINFCNDFYIFFFISRMAI